MHSRFSESFIKEFQKLYKHISEPLGIMLQYRSDEGEQSPLMLLTSELIVLQTIFLDHWEPGPFKLSQERAGFIFDLIEFCASPPTYFIAAKKPPSCPETIKLHISQFKDNRSEILGGERITVLQLLSLECLREYDHIKGTKHCLAWKNYLKKLIDQVFSLVELQKLGDTDEALKKSMHESLEQAAAGIRTRNFKHPLGEELASLITKAIRIFGFALRELQDSDERFRGNVGERTIIVDIKSLIAMTIKIDEPIQRSELELLHDVGPSLGLYGPASDPMTLLEQLQGLTNQQDIFEETPFNVSLMDRYDSVRKSNEGDFARHFLYSVVNQFIKADGVISPAEERSLKKFAQTLFGRNKVDGEPDHGSSFDKVKSESDSNVSRRNAGKITEPRNLFESMAELEELVGMERVKQDVQQLINLSKVQQMRGEKGIPISRHLVFYGNPGTGKTTVARLISQIYKELGIVSLGHLVECGRSSLVAGYMGQTALKVAAVVEESLGGVLFIDEAYSLIEDDKDPYGKEAVDTLLKLMEDHRKDLVVIVAGYPEKMAGFINSNPGLKSRFNKFFYFDDYKPDQLLAIFNCLAKQAGYKIDKDASACLEKVFEQMYAQRGENFGNGREVRNMFETAIGNQANRIAPMDAVNEELLSTLTAEDVAPLLEHVPSTSSKSTTRVGFRAPNEK